MFLDLRDDLRIGQLVRGLNSNDTFSQRLGAAQTLLELQLSLAARKSEPPRVALLTDDFVVVPVKLLAVAFLVFFSPRRPAGLNNERVDRRPIPAFWR